MGVFQRMEKKIRGMSRKDYFKAYREANKNKIAEKNKAYREANKDELAEKHKAYREANKKHKKEHPEEYLNVLGTDIYTNGITKEIEKQLPRLIDKKIKEILSEKEG